MSWTGLRKGARSVWKDELNPTMAITKDEVLHVARLANLALREDEPHEPLSLADGFANALAREDDQYRVPPTATPMEA